MMRLVTDHDTDDRPATDAKEVASGDELAAEVGMILSAMDAAAEPFEDRRESPRRSYRAVADLRLHADADNAPPLELYTRDVSAGGVGFITQTRLPLGYGGHVRLTMDDGRVLTAACQVYRCRPAIGGWYEGALRFTMRQTDIA